MSIDAAVRSGFREGLCLLPVASDGSKRPDVPSWREFQRRRPTPEQMRAFRFDEREGFGMVAGAVSQGAECWDFDCADTFEAFLGRASEVGLGDLVRRIRQGYEDLTPGGGRRWVVRSPPGVAWKDCTLAKRPRIESDPANVAVKTLIELPTFAILAPSGGTTHPSGRPYERVNGDFASIASYTAEEREALMALARSFDLMPRREVKPARAEAPVNGNRPGDDFTRRTTWPEILEPRGWMSVFSRDAVTYWRRPGKSQGVSASTNHQGSDLLWVFTSSTEFEADKSYSRFAAYAVLEHGADYAAAAAALATNGYGASSHKTARQVRTGVSSPDPAADTKWRYLSDVKPERVDWLWLKRLARGALTLWIGDGGLGKSRASIDLAARITTGALWPDGEAAPEGNVVILSAEDAPSFTIRPAVEAASGDVSRVAILDAVVDSAGRERLLQFATDLPQLEGLIDKVKPQLLIIDPLSAYFGTVLDSYRDTDVRAVLAPLVKLAEIKQIAILGIMHIGKSRDRQASHRVLGSVAFTNAARLVFALGRDPDDPDRRLLVPAKTNLCREAPTLGFRLEDFDGVARAVWESVPVKNVTADAVLGGKPALADEDQQDAVSVIQLLVDEEEWPLDAKKALAAGRAQGIPERTMRRAARKLGIGIRKSSFRSGWQWHRPKTPGAQAGTPKEAGPVEPVAAPEVDDDSEEDEQATVPKLSSSAPSVVPKRTPCGLSPSGRRDEIDRSGEEDARRPTETATALNGAVPPACPVCSAPSCQEGSHAKAAAAVRLLDEHLGPLENVVFEWPQEGPLEPSLK